MQTPESDDYIGVESCADLKSEFDPPPRFHRGTRCANSRRKSAEKEFPRPIPWLVRTENQQSQYAPWVMKRYHTDDGRLIIREERAPGHEFFVAYRSNGRLVLKLAPLDDVVEDSGHVGRLAGEDAGDGCDEGGVRDSTVEGAEFCKYDERGMTPCGGFAVDSAAAAALRPPVSI